MEKSVQDYKAVLTEIVQKLMVLLGAGMTLTKLHDVHGMTVQEDGTVTDIQGDPHVVMQNVLDEFINLSEDIIKHITEPLVNHQSLDEPVSLPAAPIQPDPEPAVVMPSAPTTDVKPEEAAVPTTPPAAEPIVADATPELNAEPTASTDQTSMTPPAQQSSTDPFPTTQPVMPMTDAQPNTTASPASMATEHNTTAMPAETTPQTIPTADPAPVPTTSPVTEPVQPANPAPSQSPAQPPAGDQTDPDMQHIINEALKQTK